MLGMATCEDTNAFGKRGVLVITIRRILPQILMAPLSPNLFGERGRG